MVEPFRISSVTEQVVDHLRRQIQRGRWSGLMPGRHELAAELGVNHKTVASALEQLERQGLLEARGSGRRRTIKPPASATNGPSLRIAMLPGRPGDRAKDWFVEIKHRLIEDGHAAFHTERCMSDLAMDTGRITRLVRNTKVDAWIVVAAARELLEWFARHRIPVFALFGRRRGLGIAGCGPDQPSATVQVTRTLLDLGHRRIVLLTHSQRRLPSPGAAERAFLSELAAAGIVPGDYHLPDWDDDEQGFHERLDSLFRLTPPTALILATPTLFATAQQFVARLGLRVPEDVSLVCMDEPRVLLWQRPTVSHVRWDSRPLVRRVIQWSANVSRGLEDLRQIFLPCEFVRGGTVGPAPVVF